MKKTLEKTFTRDGVEYTVSLCIATASCDKGSDCCQNALLVENTTAGGEKIQKVVFGYEMPDTEKGFDDMCEDSSAWDSDAEVLDIGHLISPREIVQEGLDARAAARAEETQEEQEAEFLNKLNDLTKENWEAAEQRRGAQRAAREQRKAERREERQEEAEATRRDTFMQRLFTAVAIIAAVILLWNYGAVALWLALTIGIAGLLYIIGTIWCYYGIGRKRKKEESHV